MQKVKQKEGLGTPAHGLCFFLPVELSAITLHEVEPDAK